MAIVAAAVVCWSWRGPPSGSDEARPGSAVAPASSGPTLHAPSVSPDPSQEHTPDGREAESDPEALPPGTFHVQVVWSNDEVGDGRARVRLALPDGGVREATTDADGIARFRDVPAGEVAFDAFAEPRLYGRDEWSPGYARARATVWLRERVCVRGQVRSREEGRPVADAVVFLEDHRFGVRTDARGEYVLLGCTRARGDIFAEEDPFDPHSLTILAPGYARAVRAIPPGPDEAHEVRLDVDLDPGGSVQGTVRGPDGSPVAGAEVVARAQGASDHFLGCDDHTTRADGSGRFRLDGLPFGGVFEVTARRPGYAPATVVGDLAPTADRPLVDALLVLREPAVLVVDVRTSEDRPLPHAGVLVRPSGTHWRNLDEDGVVRYADLAPGTYQVRAEAHGDSEWLPARETVEIAEGATTRRTIRLTRGVSIEGILLDDRGLPVPNADVRAAEVEDESRGRSATSAANGSFRIDGLAPRLHVLTAEDEMLSSPERVEVMSPAREVTLRVARSGLLRLRAEPPQGTDPPARVLLAYQDLLPGATAHVMERTEDGFTCLLPPGRRECRIEPEAFAPFRTVVDVASSSETVLTVRLDPGRTLMGRVTGAAGTAIADATVSHERSEHRTDAEGTFRLPHLALGPASFRVWANGYLPQDVRSSDSSIAVVMLRGALLRGRVLDAAGHGVAAEDVILFDPSRPGDPGRTRYDVSGETGAFELRMPEGRYVVALWRQGARVPVAEVDLREGETRTVEVRSVPD